MSWDILPKNRIQYIFEKLKTVIPDKESKSASQGGTDLSLVTTGEKYTWNNKSDFSGSYDDLNNKPTLGTASAKNINNTYNATSEDVATGKTIADAFDYFGLSVVNGKLCQTYTV